MTEPTPRQYGGIKSGLTKDKDAFWRMLNGYKNGGLERAVNNTQAESLKRYIDRYNIGAQTLHNKLKFHAEIYNQKKAEDQNHTDLTYTENWANLSKVDEDLEAMELEYNLFTSDLETSLDRSRSHEEAFQAMIHAAGGAIGGAPQPKLVPKPKELVKSATYQEFNEWKKSVKTYVKYYKIENLDLSTQQTILKGFVDDELETMLESTFHDDVEVPIFNCDVANTWMQCLNTFFENQFPKHCRIIDFLTSKQKQGEKTSVFVKRIKSEAVQADYKSFTPEKLLIYNTILGIKEESLRMKLAKKLDQLTFEEIEKEVATFEHLSAFNASASKCFVQEVSPSDVQAVDGLSTYRQDRNRNIQNVYTRGSAPRGRGYFRGNGRGQPRGGGRGNYAGNSSGQGSLQYQCKQTGCTVTPFWRCQAHCTLGKPQIQSLESRFGHQYKKVNELVVESLHFNQPYDVTPDGFTDYTQEDASFHASSSYAGSIDTIDFNYNQQITLDYVQAVTNANGDVTGPVAMEDNLKTPLVWLQMCDKSDIGDLSCMNKVQCLPDSGAMINCVSEELAHQLGLKIDSSRTGDIFTANGTRLDTLGCVDIKGHYRGIRVLFTAYVTRNQRAAHPYLSWRLMKRFWMLHPDWPLPLHECENLKVAPILNTYQWSKPQVTHQAKKWQSTLLEANEDFSEKFTAEENIFVESNLDTLKQEFKNVFDTSKSDNKIKMEPIEINLRTDIPIVPYVTKTARSTPYALRESANTELQKYLQTGVLRKPYPNEKIDWIAPGMWIPKPSGDGARLIVCGQKLNEYIVRKPHQFQPPLDLLRSVPPGAKYFITLDCFRGYFQAPLAAKDQAKTAFLLRESGIFMYTCLPMGSTLSSDEFCRITDEIIAPCKNVLKLIDDILIFGTTLNELFTNFRLLLERCHSYNLTLNPLKIKVAKKLKFAGYMISGKGVTICDDKVETIKDFNIPKTRTDVRSFIGCALQFKYHAPQLMGHLQPLIKLTSTKGDEEPSILAETPKRSSKKSASIIWTDYHQAHFEKVKQILTSAADNVLVPYDASKTLYIYTDASRHNGIGFVALQFYEGFPKLIECGSQTISDCARNTYSISELECLAVLFAMTKLRLYTVGNPNVVVRTDHQALCGMKKKTLDQLETARLMKMFEKLNAYNFTLEFIRGKHNVLADFMSRYPVESVPNTEFDGHTINEITLENVQSFEGKISDFNVDLFRSEAGSCSEYSQMIDLFKQGVTSHRIPKSHPARLYRQYWDSLTIQDGLFLLNGRILVPTSLRDKVLQALHIAHLGITKTRHLANQLYFWHNMNTHIVQMVEKCSKCQTFRDIQKPEPVIQTVPEFPMDHVSIDAGEHEGKKYLVMADRFTGYLWAKHLKKLTSKDCIDTLNGWFRHFGYPWHLRSDGAANFTSAEFEQFMKDHNINHQVSSAYYSESNGHAEVNIRSLKAMVKKSKNDEELQNMILEFNACPLTNGALSPMESMFGYRKKTNIPMFRHQAGRINDSTFARSNNIKTKYREKDAAYKNAKARKAPFKPLNIDTPVFIYCRRTKKWSLRGKIIALGDSPRCYKILAENGATYFRNRKYLREDKTDNPFVS